MERAHTIRQKAEKQPKQPKSRSICHKSCGWFLELKSKQTNWNFLAEISLLQCTSIFWAKWKWIQSASPQKDPEYWLKIKVRVMSEMICCLRRVTCTSRWGSRSIWISCRKCSYIHEADFWIGFSRLSYFHKSKIDSFVDKEPYSHLGCR